MADLTYDELNDPGSNTYRTERKLTILLSGKNPDGTDYTGIKTQSPDGGSGAVQEADAATTSDSEVQLVQHVNDDGTKTLDVNVLSGGGNSTQDANAATTTGSDVQLVQHVNNDGTKTLDVNVVSGGGGGDVAITPYTSGAVTSVSVTDTVSTILAGSVLGRRIVFQNRDATNPVYIGPTGSVTVANSIKVAAGASYESDDTNFAWRGITDTGITVTVAIVTFTR